MSLNLVDQLEQEMRNFVIAEIGALRGTPTPRDPLRDVLLACSNWRRREIPARPRAVHRSARLVSSDKAVEHRDELDALIAMMSQAKTLLVTSAEERKSSSVETECSPTGVFSIFTSSLKGVPMWSSVYFRTTTHI